MPAPFQFHHHPSALFLSLLLWHPPTTYLHGHFHSISLFGDVYTAILWRAIPVNAFPFSPSSLNVVTSTPKSQENTAGWCSRMWSSTHKKPCPTGEALLGSLCTRGHDRAEREGPAEETTHSGDRGKQKGEESCWEPTGSQKNSKYEEGGLVRAKGKAPAYFLIHCGLSSRLPCSCLEIFSKCLWEIPLYIQIECSQAFLQQLKQLKLWLPPHLCAGFYTVKVNKPWKLNLGNFQIIA